MLPRSGSPGDAFSRYLLQISSGHRCLADSSCRQVYKLVTVVSDFIEEPGHSQVLPTFAQHRHHVTKDIGDGDRAVNIRNDDFVRPVP